MIRRLLLRAFGLLPKRPEGFPPFAFRDQYGVEYFAWPDLSQMPPARVDEVEDIMMQIDANISRDNLAEIAEAISENIQGSMSAKTDKVRAAALAKANYLAVELLMRAKKVIPRECYYALAAVCCVRKGEDPYAFDAQTHAEKVDVFSKAAASGLFFFANTRPFATLLSASLSTEEGLRSLQKVWIAEAARRATILSVTSPGRNAETGDAGSVR